MSRVEDQSGPVDERREAVARLDGLSEENRALVERVAGVDAKGPQAFEFWPKVLERLLDAAREEGRATPSLLPEGGFGSSIGRATSGSTGASGEVTPAGKAAAEFVRLVARMEHSGDDGFTWVDEDSDHDRATLDGLIARAREVPPAPRVYHHGAALRSIADTHADVLTGREIQSLYEAGDLLQDPLAERVRELEAALSQPPAADAAPLAAGPQASQLGDSGRDQEGAWDELERVAKAQIALGRQTGADGGGKSPHNIYVIASRLLAERRALEEERDKTRAGLAYVLDHAEYGNSYGVHGSDFTCCHFCQGGGAPGVAMEHAPDCPVSQYPGAVAEWFDEMEADRKDREAAETALSELKAEVDPDLLDAIADEIGTDFKHTARAGSLRGIAKRQRAQLSASLLGATLKERLKPSQEEQS